MSETFTIATSSLWVAFEASKAGISLQISSMVTNLKEMQSDGFLARFILRTLGCWEKLSISLSAGSSLKTRYNMGL